MFNFHIRSLGDGRYGGTIIPFGVKDKHGTRFSALTNFFLGQYKQRPVFVHHNLRGFPGLVGVVDDMTLKVTDAGLYAEFVFIDPQNDRFDLDAVNEAMRMIRSNTAHFSTAVMPQRRKVAANGDVLEWPIVSLTVTDLPSHSGGTTMVEHIRGYYKDVEGEDGDRLEEWPEGGIEGGETRRDQYQRRPEGQGAPQAAEQALQAVNQRLDEVDRHLRHSLPAGMPKPMTPPRISVSSKWDKYSLSLMGLIGRATEQSSMLGWSLPRLEDDYFRSVADKLERAYKQDLKESELFEGEEDLYPWLRSANKAAECVHWGEGLPERLRRVPKDLYETYQELMPYMRSDETMATSAANQGADHVTTMMNAAVWRDIIIAGTVMRQFEVFDMPSNPFEYPTLTVPTTPMKRVVEATDTAHGEVGGSNVPVFAFVTDKRTFDAHAFGGQVLVSQEMMEDAGFDLLAQYYEYFIKYLAWTLDWALIHGDEAASVINMAHYGTDPSATAYNACLNLDGIRHEILHITTTDNWEDIEFAADSLTATRELMGANGIYGLDPADLVAFFDSVTYYDALALATIQGMDKFGERATLLTGSVMQLDGIPIVTPGSAYELTNGIGQVEDSHDTVQGSYTVCNRRGIKIGRKRNVQLNFNRDWSSTLAALLGTTRVDIQFLAPGMVAGGYDVGGV